MPNTRFPWRIFWLLLFLSVVVMVGVLPYILALFGKRLELNMQLPAFVAVQVMHATIVFGMVNAVGLLLAPKLGIRMPLLEASLYLRTRPAFASLWMPALVGLAVGVVTMLLFGGVFLPKLTGWPSEAGLPIWMRFVACLYGGINEELLMRLFLLGLVLWLLQLIARKPARSSAALFWIGNVIVAVLFGTAYLPAASKLIDLTPVAILAIMLLKGASGLVFGCLCWWRGLEAAIVAHFSADFVLHMIAPALFDIP